MVPDAKLLSKVIVFNIESKKTNMKTFNLFAILLLAVMFITSCKEEDKGTPRQTTKTYSYTQNIRGSAGVKGELPLSTLTLTDVVGADIAKNLESAELQLADTYLEVSGLNQIESPDTVAVVLKDFTIKVGTRTPVNLGDCSTDAQGVIEFESDVQQSSNKVVNLIQSIFTDITTGSKNAQITVSFMPSADITSSENVQLVIHFGGIYHYVTYD